MITKVERIDIPGRRGSKNNDVEREVLTFWESDWPACEVDVKKYKNQISAYSCYRRAVEKLKLNVAVLLRGDRLFMVHYAPDEGR